MISFYTFGLSFLFWRRINLYVQDELQLFINAVKIIFIVYTNEICQNAVSFSNANENAKFESCRFCKFLQFSVCPNFQMFSISTQQLRQKILKTQLKLCLIVALFRIQFVTSEQSKSKVENPSTKKSKILIIISSKL